MLKIAWTKDYCHKLHENHRFPMIKYDLLPEQLIHEGTITRENIFAPGNLNDEDILNVHSVDYWAKLKGLSLSRSEERRTGFPLSEQLVLREKIIAQGTIECARFALQYGMAINIAGGTHHAFTNRGEGFCLLNDIAIASCHLLRNGLAKKILVIDLDVHQGNGTAEIFRRNNSVFTFSMHAARNYPYDKEQSDLDIELADNMLNGEYIKILKNNLPDIFKQAVPDFVFYQCGVDVLDTDKLGRLALTKEGCKERDRIVLNECRSRNIPVVAVMGGGYSPEIKDIVEAHANTYRLAVDIFF